MLRSSEEKAREVWVVEGHPNLEVEVILLTQEVEACSLVLVKFVLQPRPGAEEAD